MKPDFQNIIILGAGNIATHLVRALTLAGRDIQQVYSRHKLLAGIDDLPVKPEIVTDPHKISQHADLYIICVSDDAIREVIELVSFSDSLVVHTSGSTPMDIFNGRVKDFGVFYPLQSFSASRKLNYIDIPVCIESNSARCLDMLRNLAKDVFGQAYEMNSASRLKVHLAAVFASNFTNHMYDIASEVLKEEHIPFNIIRPLIEEVARKVQEASPGEAQTGPAFRGDGSIIEKHQELLESTPDLQDIYKRISISIMNFKKSRS